MKHCILAKYTVDAYSRRAELLPRVREIFSAAADIPGVTGAEVFPNCVDRPNRYDVLIVLEMALDALAAAPVVVESNTGARARGDRTEPYPAQGIVAELRHRGIKRILSSDCHDKSNLLYGFADYKSWIE